MRQDSRRALPLHPPFPSRHTLERAERWLEGGAADGDEPWSRRCERLLEKRTGALAVLLTPSGTAALELAALAGGVAEGDEVLVPSFTFPSTANAFVLRGARPVFVDVRPDTLNLDETGLEALVTERTRAVVPVHYAGVACDMTAIGTIARRHRLLVVEDAALALDARYGGAFLGTLGDFGAFSFHGTKNVSCGEGGALAVNREELVERVEVMRDKGTDRAAYLRGETPFYTWIDVGSSYSLSELLAACLHEQLADLDRITARGRAIHDRYREALARLAESGVLRVPEVPAECEPNGHLFHVLLADAARRPALVDHLRRQGITAASHYVPLHLSPMGVRLGYRRGMLPVTEDASDRLLRLPAFVGMSDGDVDTVAAAVAGFFTGGNCSCP